jgi:hypothetical protein
VKVSGIFRFIDIFWFYQYIMLELDFQNSVKNIVYDTQSTQNTVVITLEHLSRIFTHQCRFKYIWKNSGLVFMKTEQVGCIHEYKQNTGSSSDEQSRGYYPVYICTGFMNIPRGK